jgi:hypothetical protein
MPINSFPGVLIVASDIRERSLITSVVKDAGLAPVTANAASALAALRDGAAAIVALHDIETREFLDAANAVAPHARLLLVMDADAAAIEDDQVLTVRRPLLAQELIAKVLDLMLREDVPAVPHRHAAELGITAAQLACLCMRETSTAAKGAGRRIRDLSFQIADMRADLATAAIPACAD